MGDFVYTVDGEQVVLKQDYDVIGVRFSPNAPASRRAAIAESSGTSDFRNRIDVPSEGITLLNVAQVESPRPVRAARTANALNDDASVDRTVSIFKLGDQSVFASQRVMIGYKSDPGAAPKAISNLGGKIIERVDNEFVVLLPETSDPLDVTTRLSNDPDIAYVEPDFVTVGRHVAMRPGNGERAMSPANIHEPEQYALRITRAAEAFALQTGSAAIKIAILDEGVDSRHRDLQSATTGAYDATDDDVYQEPNAWDGHGTACAGLAAGVNNTIGVRGIGAGCSIVAVRIAYSQFQGAPWITTNSWIRRAIDWAWLNGADILSNSWGGGSPSSAITNAFRRARQQGRGGKGCVVIAAAGNDSGPVGFPADRDGILAVSASNEYDEFKTRQSRDGENWWGSNFGPEVDVAAPGVHNYTTDISGEAGYDTGDYTPDFNGTSSSTPLVAGCAGLVLSAAPNLHESDVRDIIRSTAGKVGDAPYFDGRNDMFGYGRIDVFEAVQKAKMTPVA